jgi:hypothetical protein
MTLPRSDDPLSPSAIRFSEAFELFYRSIKPRWRELDARIVATSNQFNEAPPETDELIVAGYLPPLGLGTITDKHQLAIAKAEAFCARETARSDAWTRWRGHLAAGDFEPHVRDPQTGEALCLDRAGWNCSPGLGPRGGVVEDFVCPDDPWQPGPTAAMDGSLRPVFFFRDKFEAQLKKLTQPTKQKRRGKPPIYDRPRIREIVFEKMEDNGEFLLADPEWRVEADLERAVLAELARDGIEPAESTVRDLIKEPLKEWRAKKASQGR